MPSLAFDAALAAEVHFRSVADKKNSTQLILQQKIGFIKPAVPSAGRS